MKQFCFTIDDNVRFFKELTYGDYKSLFDHPYLALWRRLHQKYGLKVQLNLFYECDEFDLSMMTDRYRKEWRQNAHWLKLSFHSKRENVKPYEHSDYQEVFEDCKSVQDQIMRFATEASLAKTTTVHYCLATAEGVKALQDNGVNGLLGLYGDGESPMLSYQSTEEEGRCIRGGETVLSDGIAYAGIDVVLNLYPKEEILKRLSPLIERRLVKVMIHEQYFYSDYHNYQPDFEEKLDVTFAYLKEKGFCSIFFEDVLKETYVNSEKQ